MTIKYVKGDATRPQGDGVKIIPHVVNDVGKWGWGFVKAISERWSEPETAYRQWFRKKKGFKLGAIQICRVNDSTYVVNMIAQRGIRRGTNTVPIRYDSLHECLKQVAAFAKEKQASIHCPRIGAGLAGGSWPEIELIIQRTLVDAGIEVNVYDLR